MRPFAALAHATILALFLSSCAEPADDSPVAAPGEPLPGLSEAELASFQRGRDWFDYNWTPEEGFGPLYVQNRCSSCHDLPAFGGTGVEQLILMARWDAATGCDPLTAQGGTVRQTAATPLAQAVGIFHEDVPEIANARVTEVSPLLYGLGLIEAIPESEIESRADPGDSDGDGISGRVVRTPDGRLGRLTRKADVAGIRGLIEGALITELGLTTAAHPAEETLNGRPLPPETDPAPDPEVPEETIQAMVDFVRFLAPPAAEVPASAAARDSVAEGSHLFRQLGCAGCHVPTLVTGESPVSALSRKPIHLYSDLLLHDLGPDTRSVCAGDVGPNEVRTARLMGLRYREPYFIESVSGSVEQRIRAHGGEAGRAREAFERLNAEGRSLLLRFLRSL